ncbi:MAG: DUF177 domain-containing protein [Duncaniella sp.]|nr:DUF177 domain-containing protein [Muribaculum sp.]MCM1255963.1 DUF177 domain-containing protein [Duncaniella sp.]
MGKFSEFRLPLKTIPEGTQQFEYHLGKQFFVNMESADIHDADLTVKLAVTHKHDIYNLAFHVSGTVTLICDRCLDDLIQPIDATYDIAVKFGADYSETDELLIIPESENYLNVSYMIYDTASLAVPVKHVHPLGKCNRAMSALLRKHRATKVDDEDAELADQLIDEMETMDSSPEPDDTPSTDPRWDGLKKLSSQADNEE